jgi:hypothetical protein
MSITQTIEKPADHRLPADMPQEIPVEPVILTFTPAKEAVLSSAGEGKELISEPEQSAKPSTPHTGKYARLFDPNIPTPHTEYLAGTAAHLGDITLEQIREERLAKYLK